MEVLKMKWNGSFFADSASIDNKEKISISQLESPACLCYLVPPSTTAIIMLMLYKLTKTGHSSPATATATATTSFYCKYNFRIQHSLWSLHTNQDIKIDLPALCSGL
jgi:hypothetical protein